ncbi:MAG TPA: TrkA family potassium uptake protein [Candidatus Aerophobetes bacterium]|uniref:TrkA family potassium uptake protein n=1 Tax=Aerophobetes bacterium TaxID=2030807 RepID=A0A7V5HYH9_UNCAE|nr:TrkA family potassium uptake protein [Candidatus Aerophobetes bacterium]
MRKFAVIGLGRFGATVAEALARRGVEVIAIDKNPELVEKFKEIVTLAVRLDSTDEEALLSQGVDKVDVAIVSIGEFESCILTTALLKKIGVPKVITRASHTISDIQEKILTLVGADRIILPEVEIGKKLAQSLIASNILDYFPITEKYSAAQVNAPKKFWGKKIGDLKIRQKYRVNILEIRKISEDNKVEKVNYLPQATDMIEKGDVLLVVGEEEDIERFSRSE